MPLDIIRYATGTNNRDLIDIKKQDSSCHSLRQLHYSARGEYARFIRAESNAALGKNQEALHDYNIILNDWTSAYTERALVSVSQLYLKQKQYNEAVQQLKKLELTSEYKSNYAYAINNLLVSYFNIGDYKETLNYAALVKNYEKSSEEEIATAHLYAAKAYLATSKPAEATKELNLAALKKMHITGKGDAFQAKSTLESIIDNYENKEDGILKTAKEEITKIKYNKELGNNDEVCKKYCVKNVAVVTVIRRRFNGIINS
ncbi:hypothetical protein FQR65_LT19746 [Abscondita terminalis]|nr:hypothetical protein FQR65_LT19746 [Abscondita terminalis]